MPFPVFTMQSFSFGAAFSSLAFSDQVATNFVGKIDVRVPSVISLRTVRSATAAPC